MATPGRAGRGERNQRWKLGEAHDPHSGNPWTPPPPSIHAYDVPEEGLHTGGFSSTLGPRRGHSSYLLHPAPFRKHIFMSPCGFIISGPCGTLAAGVALSGRLSVRCA